MYLDTGLFDFLGRLALLGRLLYSAGLYGWLNLRHFIAVVSLFTTREVTGPSFSSFDIAMIRRHLSILQIFNAKKIDLTKTLTFATILLGFPKVSLTLYTLDRN